MNDTATTGPVKPLISFSIPVFNEGDNIGSLYERLDRIANQLSDRYAFEFVFTDNHSDDTTWRLLQDIAAKDSRVRALRLSRNFGFQRSILANYLHTRGDAVMQVDADLQDPPELVSEFLAHWHQGYDVVYGVRRHRPEPWLMRTFRSVGYRIINLMSEHPIPRDAGDFRLVDRKVIEALRRINTPSLYLRGIIAGFGFNQIGVPYDRAQREAGESKFNTWKLLRLGVTAVLTHSTVPLRAASLLGMGVMVLAVLGAFYYLWLRLAYPDLPTGLASIHILVIFGIGLNAFLLGLIGEYLKNIYVILRGEPIALVESTVNLADEHISV